MHSNTFLAATGAALVALASAVPMHNHHAHLHQNQAAANKRDIVWVTDTSVTVTTVPVTQTVWIEPGQAAPTEADHHHHRSTRTSHIQSTVTVPAAPPSSPAAAASSSSPSAEVSSAAPAAPSSYEAPASSSVYVAPTTTSSSVYVAPTPSTTYVAPTTTSEMATPSSYSAAPSASPSSGGGSSGQTYSGDGTYYTPGMGSCGETNSESDYIVAMAEDVMTAALGSIGNPNDNPLCNKQISISYGGKTHTATITDTCPGCAGHGLDMTPTLFQVFADLSVGRLTDVEWSYI